MQCPDCKNEIKNSNYCGCGWRKPSPPVPYAERERVKCCYDVCNRSAVLKVRTPTGWANLCMIHYDEHHQRQADETCRALGLQTVQQKREWVRRKMRELRDRMRPDYMREPGQDDDEIAAAAGE